MGQRQGLSVVNEVGFDVAAGGYDAVADSSLGRVLRSRVHERLVPVVSNGTRVLDLGCGTGIDVRWLLDRGAEVVALDASQAMVAATAKRVGGAADVRLADLNDAKWVDALADGFDVVLANFGVVSCLTDLARFGRQLDLVIRAGGCAVLVPMSRLVPWEQIPALLRFDLSTARRRFRRGSVAALGHGSLRVRYYSATSLCSALGGPWTVRSAESLGWVLPTYERRSFLEGRRRVLAALARLDRLGGVAVGHLAVGDHQIVVLARSGGR